ncbi:hypothetical protein EIP86_009333 [Pleurotus ostreatoroseus]|nr:hypothetical protein EIP86_009333 [Pleurotus ostreatoroseus]
MGIWVQLERAYRWESMRQGLQTDDRPKQIGHWMQYLRRDLKKTPEIQDVESYALAWWAWWRGMQPEWRVDVPLGGTMRRDGTGGWEKLRRPGKNGVLLVLLSLWWWKAHPSADENAWAVAVEDVKWVLEALLSRATQKRVSDGEDDDEPTRKRARN